MAFTPARGLPKSSGSPMKAGYVGKPIVLPNNAAGKKRRKMMSAAPKQAVQSIARAFNKSGL